MRTIETITADIEANAERMRSIREYIDSKVAEFRAELEAANKEETNALCTASGDLHLELQRAKAAAAAHPLEGREVMCREIRRDRSYSLRSKDKTVTLRGRIVVIRTWEDMPPINKKSCFRASPHIGDVIIQRLNAKGERLGAWERVEKNGDLPHYWKLVAEELVD